MLGAISHVTASYVTFHLRLQPGELNKPFSSVGVILYNDREGKYLNRSRFYASYAWHASISRSIKFSAGLYVGGMNYAVKGTPLSGDGSDTKADGAVGINFYSDVFHADISIGQLFNSKVQPLEEVTVLSPMINFSAHRTFFSEESIMLTPSFSSRISIENETGDKVETLFDINLLLEWRKKLLFSTGIHNNSMMIIATGINRIPISNGELGVMISYSFPAVQNTSIKRNVGEAGINYYF
jgi:hypothetical protein